MFSSDTICMHPDRGGRSGTSVQTQIVDRSPCEYREMWRLCREKTLKRMRNMFKATALISLRFDEEDYRYQVEAHDDQSEVITTFPVLGGPNVIVLYISHTN